LIYAHGGRFSLETCRETTARFVRNELDKLYYIHDCEKMLTGASNYTLDELKRIYKIIFSEDSDEGLKKPDYYAKIAMKCYATCHERIR